jgi:hypothetical protein
VRVRRLAGAIAVLAATAAAAVPAQATVMQSPPSPKPPSITGSFTVTVNIASTPRKGPDSGYALIPPVVPAGTQVVSVCYIRNGATGIYWDLVYARPGSGIAGFIPEPNLSSSGQDTEC